MLLYKRIYECSNCGLKVDRNFNVMVNKGKLGV